MQGCVVCVSPQAADEGAKILEAGGNAFDAAIATAFVQMAVLPFSCGVGGFASAHLWASKTGVHEVIDGSLHAGSRVTPDMWAADYRGELAFSGCSLFDDHRSDVGYTSICTPGTVAALDLVHRHHASLPWEELLEPAIRIAREGFPVTARVHNAVATRNPRGKHHLDGLTRIRTTPACASIFLDAAGNFPQVGGFVRNADYASTLEQLASRGGRDFYEGELAETISQDLEQNGAFVTRDDLRAYRPRRYPPRSGSYGPYTIFSNDAPGGGPLLIEALNTLNELDLSALDPSGADYLHRLALTLQLVHADRRAFLGDSEVIGPKPVERLLSKSRARTLRDFVLRGAVGVEAPLAEESDTTHLSVVDREGNIACITHSLGAFSGVVTPGLGFIYNNGMNRFDPRPGRASSLAPRKARLHLMMPTIAVREGQPAVILGAPGGNAILSALVQSFLNVADRKMSAVEAVSAPRIHAEGDTVWCEARHREHVCEALRGLGHSVIRSPDSFATGLALAQVLVADEDGQWGGGSDPRGDAGLAVANDEARTAHQ